MVFLEDIDQKTMFKKGTYRIRKVIDPLTFQLDNDDLVRLSGLDIPGRHDFTPPDHVLKTYELLKQLFENKNVTFYQESDSKARRKNRMGQYTGHIVRSQDDLWAQGVLLGNGLARVRTTKAGSGLSDRLYKVEIKARKSKTGLWASEHPESMRILSPLQSEDKMNSFQIVQGPIRKVATVNNTIYLNFGENWREDFTIALPTRLRDEILRKGTDLLSLAGQNVRVRGWIESYNGPYIEIDHPERLEFLPDADSSEDRGNASSADKTLPLTPRRHKLNTYP